MKLPPPLQRLVLVCLSLHLIQLKPHLSYVSLSLSLSSKASFFDLAYTSAEFHDRLIIDTSIESTDQLQQFYETNMHLLTGRYGILLFVYSVVLTKTMPIIESELLDMTQSLIHMEFGYASQGLINLVLTGKAVPDVWDNDKDVGGLSMAFGEYSAAEFQLYCVYVFVNLELRGITEQAEVGFITLMEQMRYCTVGSFYKNPKHPVWVTASETHLSGSKTFAFVHHTFSGTYICCF